MIMCRQWMVFVYLVIDLIGQLDREQYTRSNAATARPLILVRPAEI